VVLSFRNYNPSRFSYLRNDWYQECYRILSDSPRVVLSGNSTLGNRDYAQWLGIDENRIHLVGNAIEIADLPTPDPQELVQLRSSLQLADQTPVVLGVFRLSEEKQPLLFLDVCDRIRRQVPSLRVLLAGTGEMLRTIEKDIAIRGLGEIIEVLGPRQDVASLMSIATVMLHTSLLEGMPNAVMEAQALGLPVVATIAGGTPDCVEHGRTGFLCAAEDAEGLAQATVRLLTDRNLASNMGRMAVARMKTAFSKGQLAKEMIQIAFCHAADTAAPLSASA
jgi:glycosyltransferase involved in cell wall biosynthesis